MKKVFVVIFVLNIFVIIVLCVKFSMWENMVIELIVVSDFNKFINENFYNFMDFQDG